MRFDILTFILCFTEKKEKHRLLVILAHSAFYYVTTLATDFYKVTISNEGSVPVSLKANLGVNFQSQKHKKSLTVKIC